MLTERRRWRGVLGEGVMDGLYALQSAASRDEVADCATRGISACPAALRGAARDA